MTDKRIHKRIKLIISTVLTVLFFLLAMFLYSACRWVKMTFNVGLSAIINTIFSSLKGTGSGIVSSAVEYCLPYVFVALLISLDVCMWNNRENTGKKQKVLTVLLPLVSFWSVVGAVIYVQSSYDMIGYLTNKNQETSLYAQNYVDPRSVAITDDGQHRNLIYIYVESMENTYADIESGGKQEVNYMPNLTKLAQENVSFSATDKLGGFLSTDGSGWTMGALFTMTSGVPFAFPVGNNDMDKQEYFASGIYTLGDFLKDQGYTQEFMCGSDADFAGRKNYLIQHGDYRIFDLNMARQKGYVPEDYFVWWGVEDDRLFDMAKDEITALAQSEQPFNFTMLTVDLHHIGGYVCDSCPDTYTEPTANVVACTDRLVYEFVDWCQKQDFYENTTIVITGDHPRMDNCLVEGVAYNDRMVYNCYINSGKEPETLYGRTSTSMDIFPTVLSAMGYEIEGHRLGLGTDLFSGKETLVEQMGIDSLNAELMKSSKFYMENFAPELLHLIEDAFASLNTVYFFGEEYNADGYITEGTSIPLGHGSWVIGEPLTLDIPVDTKADQVNIRLHVQETFRGLEQSYVAIQDGQEIAKGVVQENAIADFTVEVQDGHCVFSLLFPDAVSPHDLDETSEDLTRYSLLMKTITVTEDGDR